MDVFEATSHYWQLRAEEAGNAEVLFEDIQKKIGDRVKLLLGWKRSRDRYVDALSNASAFVKLSTEEQQYVWESVMRHDVLGALGSIILKLDNSGISETEESGQAIVRLCMDVRSVSMRIAGIQRPL